MLFSAAIWNISSGSYCASDGKSCVLFYFTNFMSLIYNYFDLFYLTRLVAHSSIAFYKIRT